MILSNPLKKHNLGQVGQVSRFYRLTRTPAHTHTHAHARIAVHTSDLSHLSQTLAVARVPAVPVVAGRFFPKGCHAGRGARGTSAPNMKMEIGIPVFALVTVVTERNWPWKP